MSAKIYTTECHLSEAYRRQERKKALDNLRKAKEIESKQIKEGKKYIKSGNKIYKLS